MMMYQFPLSVFQAIEVAQAPIFSSVRARHVQLAVNDPVVIGRFIFDLALFHELFLVKVEVPNIGRSAISPPVAMPYIEFSVEALEGGDVSSVMELAPVGIALGEGIAQFFGLFVDFSGSHGAA